MAKYVTTDWRMRRTTKANTFIKTINEDDSFTHIPDEGTILETGTPINDLNLNNIELGILQSHGILDDNGGDLPIPSLSNYDNIQDMLSNVNATYFKAHLNLATSEALVNLPLPLSKFWVIRYSGHGYASLVEANGVDLTASSWVSRHNVVHQSFGNGLDSQSYSNVQETGYGLQMWSTWLSTVSTVSDSVPPATTIFGDSTDTSFEGYIFNRNHNTVDDNKMAIYCTGHSSDNVGAHMGKGMSYFSSVIYSDVIDSFIENITSFKFSGNGYLNIEILQAPSFAALSSAIDIINGNKEKISDEELEKRKKEFKEVE